MEDSFYLKDYHEKTLRSFLPVIVVMAIICVLGIVGNAFTIAFYGFASRKSPTVYMITILACVDLIVCVLIIPNMAEMGVNVKYKSAAACKVMHFVGHWAIESSALILMFISIDRYRHVCCPFKSQVNYVKAKWAMGIITIISLLQSVRDFANFDIIEFPVPEVPGNITHIFGHYCTTTNNPKLRVSVTFFHALDALVVIIVLITVAVNYGRVIWTLKKAGFTSTGSKHENYRENQTASENNTFEGTEEDFSADKSDGTDGNNETTSSSEPHETPTDVGVSHTKIKAVEHSLTIMMFAVTVVFAVCFIPYFVVKLGIRNVKNASQLELGAGIQLIIRFTYVNSFANPYIFCIFNPKFRRFIRRTISLDKVRAGRKRNESSNRGIGTAEKRTSPE